MRRPYPNKPHVVRYTQKELAAMRARKKVEPLPAEISEEEEAAINKGISRDPDNPELTDEDFARMRPAKEVLPEILPAKAAERMLKSKRGRPLKTSPKEHINLRVDADVLAAFRAKGKGWQSRMNKALRDFVKSHK